MAKPRWIKLQPFANKSVMITGGSQGMGLAVAKDVVRLGGSVCLVAIDQLDQAGRELELLRVGTDQFIETILCDTTDQDKLEPLVRDHIERRGVPDHLYNFVGYAYAQYVEKLTFKDFKDNMEVNYYGQLVPTLVMLPYFLKHGTGGTISFTSSVCGCFGLMGYATYSPSKHALVGLAETLRNELKPLSIRVSILYPPDTRTPGFDRENETKPPECALLSEKAALMEPEAVAEAFIQGILNRRFQIFPGKAKLYWRVFRYCPALLRKLMDLEYAKARRALGKT